MQNKKYLKYRQTGRNTTKMEIYVWYGGKEYGFVV
jgi:hypothetical protein